MVSISYHDSSFYATFRCNKILEVIWKRTLRKTEAGDYVFPEEIVDAQLLDDSDIECKSKLTGIM